MNSVPPIVNNMYTFIPLDEILLPQPIGPIVSVFFLFGILLISNRLYIKLFPHNSIILQSSLFIIVLGIIGSLIYIFYAIFFINYMVLRIFFYSFCFIGIVNILLLFNKKNTSFKEFINNLNNVVKSNKLILFFLAVILFGYFLISLAPPTDADSLGYHLAAPLEIIRFKHLVPRYDWYHYRLIGSGEMLNLLGLAGGTDNLGALMQFSGLAVLLYTVLSILREQKEQIFFSAALLSIPLLLFLIPNQKPELLPSVAIVLAAIIITREKYHGNAFALFIAIALCFFAMSCKYVYYMTGGIIITYCFIISISNKIVLRFFIYTFILYCVFLLPQHIHRFVYYGDPISPILERFKIDGNSSVKNFAESIQHFYGRQFIFPLNILVPDGPGTISTFIGLPVLGFIVWKRNQVIAEKTLIFILILSIILLILSGARSTRYFLPPFLWMLFIASKSKQTQVKSVLFLGISIQALGIFVILIYSIFSLFPGTLTNQLRDEVLEKNAYNYSIFKWASQFVEEGDVILSSFRSKYFFPAPFMAWDVVQYNDLNDQREREKIQNMVDRFQVNTIVSDKSSIDEYRDIFKIECKHSIIRQDKFKKAVRNPFNRGEPSVIAYYRCE